MFIGKENGTRIRIEYILYFTEHETVELYVLYLEATPCRSKKFHCIRFSKLKDLWGARRLKFIVFRFLFSK